jgi:hypothetical protein
MAESNRIYGYLKSFSKGINSDIDPLLLPADQLSFATNATMRGNFVKQRPNFFNLQLTDTTGGTTLSAFQQGLFQGACYFRTTDGSIMVAVNGKLFQITIAGQKAAVTQIQLPDDKQLSTSAKHWMWQSERFLIWNDGQNNPIFVDGGSVYTQTTSPVNPRRSNGSSLKPIGTLGGNLTVPAVGQAANSVAVNTDLTDAQCAAFVNQSVLVDTSQMVVSWIGRVTVAANISMVCNVLQSTTGDSLLSSQANSATVYQSNKYAGWITGVVQYQNDSTTPTTITDWNSILAPYGGSSPTETVISWNGSNPNSGTYAWDYADGHYLFPNIKNGQGISVNTTTGKFDCYSRIITKFGSNGAVSSLGLTPMYQGSGSGQVTSIFLPTLQYCITTDVFGRCSSYGSTYNGNNATIVPNGTGSLNGGAVGVSNYFTVQLAQAPLGLSGRYTFQAISTNGATVTFDGTVSGSQLVNCQMTNPPASSAPINLVASTSRPTSMQQVVQMTSQAETFYSIGTLYNGTVSGSSFTWSNLSVGAVGSQANVPVQGTGAQANAIILATSTTGNRDIFIVTSTTLGGGTGGLTAIFINQTGTVGNVILNGSQVIQIPELPASTIGVYGMGRNWVALPDGKSFVGGDIVGGASGTEISPTHYNYDDAVLKVSENQFLAGGTTFKVPSSGEVIRAMQFTAAIDASLGQGFLQVFTDDTVFSCNATTNQADWAKMTSPIITESLIGSGAISATGVVQSNGDLIFRLANGEVQSMLLARLDFNRWGNTPISKEISRSIRGDDPSLISYTSMAVTDNRVLMTCKPVQATRGVYSPAMVALNFDPISSLAGKATSIWDGEWNGMNVLQFITGFFGGVKRCFALCLSTDLSQIEIHEVLSDGDATLDNGTTNVQWSFETPMAFQREQSHLCKRLIDGEIYLDKLTGDTGVQAYYKVDQNNAWTPWYNTVVKYQTNDSGFRPRVGLGMPSPQSFDTTNNRPTREGYDFQVKLVITGSCRFLGGRFAADIIPQPDFAKPI